MKTVLETRSLTKRYGSLTAVDDLSLEVREGEVFGILGPNGAGKPTAISMICGLLKPTAGRVMVRGKVITNGDAATRARIGVCPQGVVLWGKLTCAEQLQFIGEMYGMRGRDARARGLSLLDALGLSEKRDKTARTLSGGMQRRLNLAMALVHDPEILILDEPEAGLDPQSRVMVRDFIRSLARRKTVILTTHNMDEADRLSDRVAIIDHGKLLVVDTPASLKRTAGEGDVLEIDIEGGPNEEAIGTLRRIFSAVSVTNHTLIMRNHGAVELLPAVLDALRGAGITAGEVRLRSSSLEDVFISLTGRRMRE